MARIVDYSTGHFEIQNAGILARTTRFTETSLGNTPLLCDWSLRMVMARMLYIGNVKAVSNTNDVMASSAIYYTPTCTANRTFTAFFQKDGKCSLFLSVKAVTNKLPEPDNSLDYLFLLQLVS